MIRNSVRHVLDVFDKVRLGEHIALVKRSQDRVDLVKRHASQIHESYVFDNLDVVHADHLRIVEEVTASLAQIALIIPVAPTVQIEDLEILKTEFCERTTPTFRAKKIDAIGTVLLSWRCSKTVKKWFRNQIVPRFW